VDGTHARYDDHADFYADLVGDATSDPATSALLDLLPDVTGKRILDLACGHGRLSRELARRGASVVGADISHVLLNRARTIENAEPLGVAYEHADAASATALVGETFAGIVCNYGLSDMDNLDAAITTVARLLEPTGLFVFSILHPCFPGSGADVSSAWPAGGYHQEGWWLSEAASSGIRRRVGANHRMLATYLNALTRQGLIIDEMNEPASPEIEPPIPDVPIFFVARCHKK